MSELSIAELASENAELLPQRETLSTIVIKASSTAFAHDGKAVSINNINIVNSFDDHNIVLPHHMHHHMHHHMDHDMPVG